MPKARLTASELEAIMNEDEQKAARKAQKGRMKVMKRRHGRMTRPQPNVHVQPGNHKVEP